MLLDEEEQQPGPISSLAATWKSSCSVCWKTAAVQKFDENRKGDLTFADACRFWGINENMKSDALDTRIRQVQSFLIELDRILADADAELSTGRVLFAERYPLSHQHHIAIWRIASSGHLNLLRTRAVKR